MIVKVFDNVRQTMVRAVGIIRPVQVLLHVVNVIPLDILNNATFDV